MTPEAQRIAIAEACGWTKFEWAGNLVLFGTLTVGDKRWDGKVVPDYLNDLNAMHEAEKVLRPDGACGEWPLWDKYVEIIAWKTGVDDVVHATAAEKAEAFLRTLNIRTNSK